MTRRRKRPVSPHPQERREVSNGEEYVNGQPWILETIFDRPLYWPPAAPGKAWPEKLAHRPGHLPNQNVEVDGRTYFLYSLDLPEGQGKPKRSMGAIATVIGAFFSDCDRFNEELERSFVDTDTIIDALATIAGQKILPTGMTCNQVPLPEDSERFFMAFAEPALPSATSGLGVVQWSGQQLTLPPRLSTESAMVLRWYNRALASHSNFERVIALMIACDIAAKMLCDSAVVEKKPYRGPTCGHEIHTCPQCNASLLKSAMGDQVKHLLMSFGMTAREAKDAWDLRQFVHGKTMNWKAAQAASAILVKLGPTMAKVIAKLVGHVVAWPGHLDVLAGALLIVGGVHDPPHLFSKWREVGLIE